MNLNELIKLTFIINLVISFINVLVYGIGYYKVSKVKVDSKLSLTKKALLFEFFSVSVFAILQVVIYFTVVFDGDRTTEAIYLENIAILFFNIAFAVNALVLAYIAERK